MGHLEEQRVPGGHAVVPGDDLALVERDDDVGEFDELVELGGREQDRHPVSRGLADEPVDGRPPADVHATRGFVQEQHFHVRAFERPCDEDLLLGCHR